MEKLTTYIAHFTDYIGKHLPDDVKAKISELAEAETNPLAKSIYETMNLNQRLASGVKQTELSGYRCDPVLGKMRNKVPADR